MVKETYMHSHKKSKAKRRQRVSETKTDEDEEDKEAYLEVTGSRNIPPPPVTKGLFKPVFMKGKNDIVMASDSGLGSKLVARSFLNGIFMKREVAKFRNVPMEKLMTK